MVTNFSWVIPSKLAGCSLPHSERDIQWLSSQGIRNLVSLTRPDHEIGSLCQDAGITWMPYYIPDFSVPQDGCGFDHLVRTIVNEVEKEHACCVHCHAGIGRTGLLLACVVGTLFGVDGASAIATIKKMRPAIDTDEQIGFVSSYLRCYEN